MNPHRMYVTELRRRLPEYYFRPVRHRVLWILPYVVVVVLSAQFILTGNPSLAGRLAASGAISVAFSGLMLLGHEIVHGAMVRRPWARELLGGISLLPLAVSPLLWRLWHNVAHHSNTQVHGRDPDTYSTLAQYGEQKALRILHRLVPMKSLAFFALLTVWFSLRAVTVLSFLWNTGRLNRRHKMYLAAEVAVAYLFWIGISVLAGWRNFVFIYVLPVLVTNFVAMCHIATNHLLNPLLDEDDPLAGSLSLREPKILDVWLSNFSHHTEHHVFPAMSAKYLPHVRKLLRELWPDRYHEMSLWEAMAVLWKTPRLYLNNIRLIDPISGDTYGVLGHGLDPRRVQPLL